jgi:myo-inositol-1(or 4)-monophosphatase
MWNGLKTNMPQYSATMNVMLTAARKAARGLIRDFGEVQNLQVSKKGAHDFTTEADLRSEKIIVDELKRARPAYGFLLEEGGVIEGTDPVYRWIIDPLDGTTNFLHGIPFFCISIALEKTLATGKKEIVAAVIYAPLLRETFWAEKGAGAWLEKEMASLSNQDRLRVSGRKNKEEALVLIGGLAHGGMLQQQRVSSVTATAAGLRDLGSSALSLAYIAAGRGDVFFQTGEHAWDIAAGILLILEAGGTVTEIAGGDAMLETGDILATNSLLHRSFLTVFK